MIYFSDKQYATFWEAENKGNYTLVRMSTSRKIKDTGEYKNSNWAFVRFVKDAHDKVDTLVKKDRIIIKGGMSLEPYTDADGNKKYPKNPQLVIFNFEFPEARATESSEENDSDEPLPF
jgi:single-stranded DNA-binding protein